MSSLQDDLVAIGLETTLDMAGDEIVYHRGADELTFQTIRGQHVDQAVENDTVLAEVERVDYLFPIAELATWTPAEPGKDDWIEYAGEIWQVTEQPGVGWWRYMDPAHTWVRVRVTRTGSV